MTTTTKAAMAQAARPPHDAEYDAGDTGCGELVMYLRIRMKEIPGGVLKLIAHDPGAIEDLPAWCRMTGHTLLQHDAETHTYWLRARM
jgi:tRNA 2-thiouridine synthesizing protein A